MENSKVLNYVKNVLDNRPQDWMNLTTHRLDIYNEERAKFEFLDKLESLFKENNFTSEALAQLPTAYDYIRLGHPLSCLLEWAVAQSNELSSKNVISFSSQVIPILSVLRKNLLDNKNTRIVYKNSLPESFNVKTLQTVYNYKFELQKLEDNEELSIFDGSTILVLQQNEVGNIDLKANVDFLVNIYEDLGSIILVNGEKNESYISEIQHVRRRETIAMTPAHCYSALQVLVGNTVDSKSEAESNKALVIGSIKKVTDVDTKALLGSCGLSIQYAITMGLVDHALEKYKGKEIKIVVPPNCYGGTNDQARRVAACVDNVEVVDLPVDGDGDMVQSVEAVLNKIATEDAVPFIIAEIPTNPRVEVPDLVKLNEALNKERKTKNGEVAIEPVFILDQTFCPNLHFLGDDEILSNVKTISYVSGSKFPSGGKCTAGYCVANKKAESLMGKVELHLKLCGNEATDQQLQILADQLPSMTKRISDAYKNTREFVNFIMEKMPDAKINFVSEDLAKEGFTPSVFSLDLPTKGNSPGEKEAYKKDLNHKLISLMIQEIPGESKHCVSYGQLKGCYWTIPATSTQGTTKEGDKDYIVRVAASPNMDVEKHKKVFAEFASQV